MRPKALFRSISSLLLLAGLGSAARAELLPPAKADFAVQDLSVIREDGTAASLSALTSGRPALLLPVYTSCAGSCPITTEGLRNGLSSRPDAFRVVLLSFDPKDGPDDLKAFRARHALPPSWAIVRGADAAATRAFLDQFGFRLMTQPGGFDHPDETFVLSPKGVWAATFAGPAFAAGELDEARERAVSSDAPSGLDRARRPGFWITGVFAALVFSAAALFAVAGGKPA